MYSILIEGCRQGYFGDLLVIWRCFYEHGMLSMKDSPLCLVGPSAVFASFSNVALATILHGKDGTVTAGICYPEAKSYLFKSLSIEMGYQCPQKCLLIYLNVTEV